MFPRQLMKYEETCDRTILGEGFIDRDQLERFSVKHEHNQHT
jgi:hypothetical protein